MNKKKAIWTIIGLLVIGGIFVALRTRETVRSEVLLPIERAPFIETVETRGEVDALFYEELRAPGGRYSKQLIYLCPEGSEVSPGDLVAEFDTAELLQNIDELREKEAEEKQARLDTELTADTAIFSQQVILERSNEELNIAEVRKISMQYEADKRRSIAVSEFNNVRRSVQAAEKKLKQLQFDKKEKLRRVDQRIERIQRQISNVEKQLEQYRFTAERESLVVYPVTYISGLWKKAEEGDTLSQNREFARLPEFSSKIIRVYLEEQWVNKIKEQGAVTFTPISYPETLYHGNILSISTLATEGHYRQYKKFFEVIVEIDSSDAEAFARLKPGMVCNLQFLIRNWGEAVAIPKDYIRISQDGVPLATIREDDGGDRLLPLDGTAETADYYLLTNRSPEHLTLVYKEL
ncbi:HlyD family secretion protein [Tichowtungia aerotolerans]|uniref:HlyD family efflux transporter periplasmic adaptor subunit n=1 Tax=Tichowtungia aerotolerans TaxID=2697043 RepID=A0A6P1M2R0_9BACT|nr:efflux RND transporter periplasmic adaptor subunit [Tichowtungia aerotolerans]QHI68131.1 hypothetical protein GT409_01235 [Tichowtungia aerotolerans]